MVDLIVNMIQTCDTKSHFDSNFFKPNDFHMWFKKSIRFKCKYDSTIWPKKSVWFKKYVYIFVNMIQTFDPKCHLDSRTQFWFETQFWLKNSILIQKVNFCLQSQFWFKKSTWSKH